MISSVKPFSWLPNQEGFRFVGITEFCELECEVKRDPETQLHYVTDAGGHRVEILAWKQLNKQPGGESSK